MSSDSPIIASLDREQMKAYIQEKLDERLRPFVYSTVSPETREKMKNATETFLAGLSEREGPLFKITASGESRDRIRRRGSHAWLHDAYPALCQIPETRGCDATLAVEWLAFEMADGSGALLGTCDVRGNHLRISCAHRPSVMLATLMHEVAHWVEAKTHCNRRSHGYRWRRAFAAIASRVTGFDVAGLARELRELAHRGGAPYGDLPVRESLDEAVEHAISVGLTDAKSEAWRRMRLLFGKDVHDDARQREANFGMVEDHVQAHRHGLSAAWGGK